MTEKTKQEPEKIDKSKKSNGQSRTSHSARLAIIGMFFALVALFAAIYSLIQAQLLDKSLNQELLLTNQTINSMVEKQQELVKKIDQLNEKSKKQLLSFENKLDIFQQAMKETKSNGSDQPSHWRLKKAQFYLQLAQISAHWSQHPQMTVDLLKQADKLLADQNNLEIYDIRQAISNDINDINKQSQIDIVGLLTKLTTAQNQLQKLTYRNDHFFADKKNSEKKQNGKEGKWRKQWMKSINALEKLVVIRHHDQAIKPILTDKQFALVKEAIYIDLQQAKWAVIHNNQAVYKLAVGQALNEMKRHFNMKQTVVETIVSQLQSLQNIQIEQKTIEPSKALILLNKYINFSNLPSKKDKTLGGKPQ